MPTFKFTGSLHGLKLNGEFNKTFDEAAKRLVRQAAREWLRTVVIHVGVWTGFLLGSIKFARGEGGNLASFLRVAIPIEPKSQTPKWYYHNGPHGRKIEKRTDQGGQFAQFSFPSAQHRYRFRFRDDVIHFFLNEFFDSVSPTSPWHSMRLGRNTFKAYIRQNLGKLPHIKKYIVRGKVEFIGG